jgi:hypothetical protein
LGDENKNSFGSPKFTPFFLIDSASPSLLVPPQTARRFCRSSPNEGVSNNSNSLTTDATEAQLIERLLCLSHIQVGGVIN